MREFKFSVEGFSGFGFRAFELSSKLKFRFGA